MRRILPLALLLPACAPLGRIRSPRLDERLRSAWALDGALGGQDARLLVLSTSAFPCGLPEEPDPDAITAADAAWLYAWTREGSLIVAFALFALDAASEEGSYPVDETASPSALDDVEPRAALAAFHAVWEAEVSAEDGIYREYEPVDEQLVLPVEGPGELSVADDGDGLSGTFSLDSLDVSGSYRAELCPPGQDDLLSLDMLSALLGGAWAEHRDDTGGLP